jgi:hypothetical protein
MRESRAKHFGPAGKRFIVAAWAKAPRGVPVAIALSDLRGKWNRQLRGVGKWQLVRQTSPGQLLACRH